MRSARRDDARGDPRGVAVLRQSASVLLGYPDDRLFGRLPLVRAALRELPDGRARAALLGLCDHIAATPALDLGAHYVETFDLRRRRALHMTFYTDGDTRRRGTALLHVSEVYAACGWAVEPGELPDHLAVLLEFAARGDPEWGETLLVRFQPGLELLRAALHRHGTPYCAAVDAVSATLPPPGTAQREAVRRLARVGPPAESVGLEPYGPRPAGNGA